MKRITLALFALLLSCSVMGAASLSYPSGTLTTWDGSFHWQGVQGATWYLLEVWQGSILTYRQWYPMSCSDCSVKVTLPPNSYQWQVLDWSPSGYGQWSWFTAFSFSVFQAETPIPPPVEWHVPTDGTFAEAMQKMTRCGTVYIEADISEPAISYGESRTASYIIPDYGCDWTIEGVGSPIVTYDADNPPLYYDAPGILMMVKNSHKTTVTGLHFVGTMALGDGVGIDRDICLLLDAAGNMGVIGNEFERCGHAGFKHFYGSGDFLVENNTFHDNGFTSRDHHIYLPGGGNYIIRDNRGWNASGWCVGYGNVYFTTGAVVTNNICWDNGGGISVGIGEGAQVENNIAIGNARGLWLEGGGNVIRDNVFMESSVEDVYSERACGAVVTNWCSSPVPNDFYDNGNIFETVSHPERIE